MKIKHIKITESDYGFIRLQNLDVNRIFQLGIKEVRKTMRLMQ